MNIDDLKKEIACKWKVQTISKYKPQATCVAYIDARDAENMLDNVCGPENWQDAYREIKGQMFCGISIKCNDEWITKWDTGTSGNFEKEKSLSSDAFKRAAVKWGIGRFLYDTDVIYIATNEAKKDKNYPYPVDSNGKRIWNLTKHFNNNKKANSGIKPDDIAPEEKSYKKISDFQYINLREICDSLDFPIDETLQKMAKVVYQLKDIKDLPADWFDAAVKKLEGHKK